MSFFLDYGDEDDTTTETTPTACDSQEVLQSKNVSLDVVVCGSDEDNFTANVSRAQTGIEGSIETRGETGESEAEREDKTKHCFIL